MMPGPESSPNLERVGDYERATRGVRLIAVLLVLVTIPPHAPQAFELYSVVAGMVLFSGLRLLAPDRFLTSRVAALIIDNVFIALLVMATGQALGVYTGLFVLTLLAATFWYRLIGMLVSLAAQLAAVVILGMVNLYPPLNLSATGIAVMSLGLCVTVAVLVERLTRHDHAERLTLERLSEQNRLESDNLLALINSLPDAVVLLDSEGTVELANTALTDLVQAGNPAVGQNIAKLVPLRNAKGKVDLAELVRGDDKPARHLGLSATSAAGAEVRLDVAVTPTGNEDNRHFIVILKDVTNEKSLDEQRKEFISVASHELRTPLSIAEAAISTMLLMKKDFKPEAVSLAEQALRNVVFLSSLVKDLTTLAEAQRDSLTVEIKPLNTRMLVDQVYNDFLPVATEKGLTLKKQYMPDLPTVLTTEHHVREILQNLISNAIKYTKSGGVTVRVKPTSTGGVVIAVADTGVGISAANQSKLFTKFFRAEDYRTRETGGTGLGLYLCLELANRINARLWAESKLNLGSTFYLELPPASRLARDRGQVAQANVQSLVDQL